MENDFMNTIGIEKFAAFLDGNLLPDEIQQISSLVAKNDMMRDIYNASNEADETLANYNADDLTLPDAIVSDAFHLPSIDNNFHQQILLDTDLDVTACACTDLPEIDTTFESMTFDNPEFQDRVIADDPNHVTPTQSDTHTEIDDILLTSNE